MFWKIALTLTVIYYTILIVLDKKSRQAYRLKEAAAQAIGKTEIGTGTETTPSEIHPDLFGATTNGEEDTPPVVEVPKTEKPIRETQTEETLPEPASQNYEIAPAEILPQRQEPEQGTSPEVETPKIPQKAPVEKSTPRVAEETKAVPKTDDEERRNFLFGGTSLAADATLKTPDEVVVNRELARDLEGLIPKSADKTSGGEEE